MPENLQLEAECEPEEFILLLTALQGSLLIHVVKSSLQLNHGVNHALNLSLQSLNCEVGNEEGESNGRGKR